MRLIKALKKNKILQKIYNDARTVYYCGLTVLSPELNTRARYKSVYGTALDLNNPTTFSEKLLWLKLNDYIDNPLVIQCADKYRVREYVKDCACGDILNELYGVYNTAQDIPWDKLPKQFVLKWNFGAGMNIVVKDKSQLDILATMRKFERWGKTKCWLPHSEMQYKKAEKKIVCEKYLVDNDNPDVIPDYKVYCFHGEPKAIFVMHDRGHGVKSEFFDVDWKALENTEKYEKPVHATPRPACFEQMMKASRKLSSPFPFVRCDYYVVNGKLIFGEMTFTPAGGLYTSTTKIDGKDMSEFLHVEKTRSINRGGVLVSPRSKIARGNICCYSFDSTYVSPEFFLLLKKLTNILDSTYTFIVVTITGTIIVSTAKSRIGYRCLSPLRDCPSDVQRNQIHTLIVLRAFVGSCYFTNRREKNQ